MNLTHTQYPNGYCGINIRSIETANFQWRCKSLCTSFWLVGVHWVSGSVKIKILSYSVSIYLRDSSRAHLFEYRSSLPQSDKLRRIVCIKNRSSDLAVREKRLLSYSVIQRANTIFFPRLVSIFFLNFFQSGVALLGSINGIKILFGFSPRLYWRNSERG